MLGRERIALVFTNQLRQKLNAQPFADQWTTSGGKAIGFHASTRIRLTHTGKIKDKAGNIVGASVKARLDKNRLGPPHREAEFEVYFNRGMDDYPSWLKVMKEYDILKQKGAWYTYDDNGNEIQFQSKDFRKFIEEDQIRRDKIYQQICDSVIMKYQQADIDIDTLEVVAASEEE
jgi:recombination protein RecA